MKKALLISILILFFVCISVFNSFAQYPERNIRLIIPYDAGGGTDVGARIFANTANKYFLEDIAIIPENMPGSSGLKADSYIVRTKADGYTIYCLNASTARLTENSPVKTADFQPVAGYVFDPLVLVVSKESEYSNFENFLEVAKGDEGASLNTSGAANLTFLMGKLIEAEVPGVKFRYVNANSGALQIQQLLGNHVDAGFLSMGEAYGLLESGDLKALAYSGDERHPVFSDIPTLQELGVDIVIGARRGIAVSAETPTEIVEYLADLCEKVIKSEEFVQEMEKAGFPVTYGTGEEYKEILLEYERQITPLVIELGL